MSAAEAGPDLRQAPQPPVALTIAGSDSGGGAGMQADLKTFACCGVFGTSAVTALTAQNTVGVRSVFGVPTGYVAEQLDAVLDDLPVAAVKTGMLATVETVTLVAEYAGRLPNLVVDPVLVATSGDRLFPEQAHRVYLDLLFPAATAVTPNLIEAGVLLGRRIESLAEAEEAARALAETGAKCVVVKGGHLVEPADDIERPNAGQQCCDVVWYAGQITRLRGPRVATDNTHGTGCTFAAALTARLAAADPLPVALHKAKSYVNRALHRSAGWRLGAGSGPLSWEVC